MHRGRTAGDFLRVTGNIRALTRAMNPDGHMACNVHVSFIVGRINFREIGEMLRTASEAGAGTVHFGFASIREQDSGNPMRLSDEDLAELRRITEDAIGTVPETGLGHNLRTFASSVPHYLDRQVVGPAVVPCYIGWYTTFILGNGSVLPCAQSIDPVGCLDGTRSFREIWLSKEYSRFRRAARALPLPDPDLGEAECAGCTWRWKNLEVHNLIRPWSRITCGDDVRRLRLSAVPARLLGKAAGIFRVRRREGGGSP
jgi:MoaA/NifB/PqqE/SkfB family radical SAM enzyme